MPEKQITINKPPEQVFAYVSDLTKHPEWTKHELAIRPVSEGAVGQGSKFTSAVHGSAGNEETVEVTEYVPNQKFVYEAEGKMGRFRHWFQLQPADGGTQLSKGTEAVKANMPYSILLPIVGPLMLPGVLNGDLQRIKEKVEGQS